MNTNKPTTHGVRPWRTRLALTAMMAWGLAQTPCWAQHLNSPQAPCRTAGADPEMTACFDHAYRNGDLRLNQLYQQIQAVLEPADRQRLETAERAWLKFRDAACDAEYDLYDGGSGGPLAYAACREEETRLRVGDLQTTYDWRLNK